LAKFLLQNLGMRSKVICANEGTYCLQVEHTQYRHHHHNFSGGYTAKETSLPGVLGSWPSLDRCHVQDPKGCVLIEQWNLKMVVGSEKNFGPDR
jgi:hypothetical protein